MHGVKGFKDLEPILEHAQMEAELVISHCTFSLDWLLPELTALNRRARISRITIYSKCGRKVVLPTRCSPRLARPLHGISRSGKLLLETCRPGDLPWPHNLTRVVTLPNHGRCDHTYAYHMATRYDQLSPLVFFLKDTSFKNGWTILKKRQYPVDVMAAQAVSSGFSCRMARRAEHGQQYSVWHIREVLTEYESLRYATKHDQATRPEHRTPFNSPFRPMSAWLSQSGVFANASSGFLPDVEAPFRQLSTQSLWPACYGGGFATKRSQIRRWPQQMWQRLARALSRGDNIEEGHYAERLWAVLLVKPPSRNASRALLCAANRQIRLYQATRQLMGLLYLCNCTSQCSARGLQALPTPIRELG
uniref:Uncharacterized protein n=1 Tax=Haptolina ericina TaxID=156174 RepID=A0A7S3EWQ7_9EUKA